MSESEYDPKSESSLESQSSKSESSESDWTPKVDLPLVFLCNRENPFEIC